MPTTKNPNAANLDGIRLNEQASTPADTIPAGKRLLFVDDAGVVKLKDSAGNVSDVGGAGSGDMEKSTYDANDDSIIDAGAGGLGANASAFDGIIKMNGSGVASVATPNTDYAAAAHASRHAAGGADEIDGGALAHTVSPAPSDYTPTANTVAGHFEGVNSAIAALSGGGGSGDMTKAVYDPNDDGIIAPAQGGLGVDASAYEGILKWSSGIPSGAVPNTDYSPPNHGPLHIKDAVGEIDGDQIDIDWNPTNSTPDTTPAEVTHVDHLTAILAGMDNELANKAEASHNHAASDITSGTLAAARGGLGADAGTFDGLIKMNGAGVASVAVPGTDYAVPGGGGLPTADYDSGWFAVGTNTTYTKAHSLGAQPRLVIVHWSSTSGGTTAHNSNTIESDSGFVRGTSAEFNSTNVVLKTGAQHVYRDAGTSYTGGYMRILAWS